MTDRSGLITAPDFDADGYYDFNVACDWLIKVASNSAIAYQVVNMEIGAAATAGCKGDMLRVSTSGTRFFSDSTDSRSLNHPAEDVKRILPKPGTVIT